MGKLTLMIKSHQRKSIVSFAQKCRMFYRLQEKTATVVSHKAGYRFGVVHTPEDIDGYHTLLSS
jgi:hypothetical protein